MRLNRPRKFGPFLALALLTTALVAVPVSNRTTKAAGAQPSTAATTARQLLFIDQVTGQPREASAAELEQLRQMQAAIQVAPPVPIVSQDGNLPGLALSEDQMVFSVATKNPDGTVRMSEAVGRRDAVKAVHLPVSKAGKESRDDR